MRTYTVYRSDWSGITGSRRAVLHVGKSWLDACALQSVEEAKMKAEPDYRPNVMSRPLICIEYEKPLAPTKGITA